MYKFKMFEGGPIAFEIISVIRHKTPLTGLHKRVGHRRYPISIIGNGAGSVAKGEVIKLIGTEYSVRR